MYVKIGLHVLTYTAGSRRSALRSCRISAICTLIFGDLRSDLAGSRRSALRSCRISAICAQILPILAICTRRAISCGKNSLQICCICYIMHRKSAAIRYIMRKKLAANFADLLYGFVKNAPAPCPYGQTPTLPIFGFSGFLGDRLDFWDFGDFPPSRFPQIR